MDTLRIVIFVLLANSVVGAFMILILNDVLKLKDHKWSTLWNSGILGKISIVLFFCGIATPVSLGMIVVFFTIFLPAVYIMEKIYYLFVKERR